LPGSEGGKNDLVGGHRESSGTKTNIQTNPKFMGSSGNEGKGRKMIKKKRVFAATKREGFRQKTSRGKKKGEVTPAKRDRKGQSNVAPLLKGRVWVSRRRNDR